MSVDRIVAALQRLRDTAAAVGIHDAADDVHRAAGGLLRETISCDDIMLVEHDAAGAGLQVRTGDELSLEPSLGTALARVGGSHPAVPSYLRAGDNLLPRRVSDVATTGTWRRSPAYVEVFRGRGAHHQLTFVTDPGPQVRTGWVLSRGSADFSDEDVHLATLVWPQLVTMTALAHRMPTQRPVGGANLTAREVTVLRALASGQPACSIARRLGIAEATVRKHLERVYTKLDVHDRLSAALRGQELGYIEPLTVGVRQPVRTSAYVERRVDVLH